MSYVFRFALNMLVALWLSGEPDAAAHRVAVGKRGYHRGAAAARSGPRERDQGQLQLSAHRCQGGPRGGDGPTAGTRRLGGLLDQGENGGS